MFKDKIHGRFVIIGGFFSLFLYVQYRHILSESHDVRFYSLQGTVTGLGFDCRTGRVTTFEGEKDGIYSMVSKKKRPETKKIAFPFIQVASLEGSENFLSGWPEDA